MGDGTRMLLITGATGGIGSVLSERLARSGHALVLAARDANKLQALCTHLPAPGAGQHNWLSVDMTEDSSIAAFETELAARGIVLDGLVLMPPQLPRSNDPLPNAQTWRDAFQNSFIGPLALLKAALSRMQPDPENGGRPKVVVISAISSVQVLGHYALSNAVRAAWAAEAKTVAFALGGRGIHINTLSLGGILTPHYTRSIEERARDAGMTFEQRLAEETSNVPLGKYGTPQDVAAVVEGLLSQLSDHMTGMNIMLDGGFTRAY